MSRFVNFKKRGVTLPPGCKDLIDLLHSPERPRLVSSIHTGAIPPDARAAVTRGESFDGKLSDMEKYVAMVFESHARSFILMVTPPDERFTIDVAQMENRIFRACVVVQAGTDQEEAVRTFFAHRDWPIPDYSGLSPRFVPDLPGEVTCEISPIPFAAPDLSRLLADLSRAALGVSDEAQLCFRCYEIGAAP